MATEIQGFRLSPQQEHLWSCGHDAQAFMAHCVVLIEGPLNVEVLRVALGRVIERHEILRTTFYKTEQMQAPLQVVARSTEFNWHLVNERELRLASRSWRHEPQVGFDGLAQKPLCASLARLAEEKHTLSFTLPATCADACTFKNILAELSQFYAACMNGGLTNHRDEPLQYVHFSEWQNELLEDEEATVGREFWRAQAKAGSGGVKLPRGESAGEGAREGVGYVKLRLG